MPELPEVETIARALQAHLPEKTFERILVRDARLRWPVDETRLRQLVEMQTVVEVGRRAKYLLISLRQESTLVIHLGMSGRLSLLSDDQEFEKHDHVIFYFTDGTQLRFCDPRRFGLVDAIPPGGLADYPRFVHLGIEPLARTATATKLYARAADLKRPVKNLLMDSTFIVGVGNIYANEALHQAGIHPATPSSHLSRTDWSNLLKQIKSVLRSAIAKGGTTLNDFVDSNGEIGYFQLSLSAYGREGEPCKRCGTAIRRIVQVGRSTYFCPNCQQVAGELDPQQEGRNV